MAEAAQIERLSADSPHIATLAGWSGVAWGHLNPGMTLNDAIERLRGQCSAGGVPSLFVAMHDGVPVGMASLVVDDMSDRPDLSPWLALVFVPPEWRGLGITSSLVRQVESEAQDSGVAWCYLYTPDQQALYARLGWQAAAQLHIAPTAISRQIDLLEHQLGAPLIERGPNGISLTAASIRGSTSISTSPAQARSSRRCVAATPISA